MNPAFTRAMASIGVAFLVLLVVEFFVLDLSTPIAVGIGAGVGVALGIVNRRAKRKNNQS